MQVNVDPETKMGNKPSPSTPQRQGVKHMLKYFFSVVRLLKH